MDHAHLKENLENIRGRISEAARASGRTPESVLLMPAVKYADADSINYLHAECGVNDIGENRVQQLLEHWDAIGHDGLRVHFIGSLQTNKVKYIIDKVYLIHSLDSERLAAEIDRCANRHGIKMRVLVEINSGREESKGGVLPEQAEELCLSLEKYSGIELCGFMTMAPRLEDKAEYRVYFSKTRELCDRIWYGSLGKSERYVLSMGMSDSFEEAIAEGSTLVRVGSGLFGKPTEKRV